MYGILISLSILISLLVAEYFVNHDKRDKDIVWSLASILIISGIVGARVYYVITHWNYYRENIVSVLYIWEGGIGILGGIILGILTIVIYLKLKNKSVTDIWYYLSIMAISAPIGQAIGRWGNYFNKELYGKLTTLPWGINIEGRLYHPLFFYESILNLILFIILITLKNKKKNPKLLIGIYLAGYSTIRFFLEYIKTEPLLPNQVISIMFLGVAYLIIKNDIHSK